MNEPNIQDLGTYDYVIAGAGSAGCVLQTDFRRIRKIASSYWKRVKMTTISGFTFPSVISSP